MDKINAGLGPEPDELRVHLDTRPGHGDPGAIVTVADGITYISSGANVPTLPNKLSDDGYLNPAHVEGLRYALTNPDSLFADQENGGYEPHDPPSTKTDNNGHDPLAIDGT